MAGLVVAGGLYMLYSYLVQQYARGVVQKMMNVPAPEALIGTDHHLSSFTIAPSDLRPTVSKSTNLVTHPDDCLRWHQWIIANRNNDNTKVGPDTIRSLATKAEQQMFLYRYRTYMNFEETYSVHRPFWTWQRFLFSFLDVTKLQFFPATTQQGSEAKGGAPIATAQVQDKQSLFGGLLRLRVTWLGNVVPQQKEDSDEFTIDWESTKAEIFLPWNKADRPAKVIENPKVASKMAKDPWDIVKFEDGMICLKRGTVGYLVYDLQQA